HPVARVALKILGDPDARQLAAILACVGLAQNLSALRALATTGIQAGHMRLHAPNLALAAGLAGDEAAKAARGRVSQGAVSGAKARELSTAARGRRGGNQGR